MRHFLLDAYAVRSSVSETDGIGKNSMWARFAPPPSAHHTWHTYPITSVGTATACGPLATSGGITSATAMYGSYAAFLPWLYAARSMTITSKDFDASL